MTQSQPPHIFQLLPGATSQDEQTGRKSSNTLFHIHDVALIERGRTQRAFAPSRVRFRTGVISRSCEGDPQEVCHHGVSQRGRNRRHLKHFKHAQGLK